MPETDLTPDDLEECALAIAYLAYEGRMSDEQSNSIRKKLFALIEAMRTTCIH